MLNLDVTRCEPKEPKDEWDRVVLDTLALLTMRIGLNEITKKNWQEFYARVHTLELLSGGDYIRCTDEEGKPVGSPIEAKDVKRWIGLSTNASTRTRTQFLKSIGDNEMRETIYQCRNI